MRLINSDRSKIIPAMPIGSAHPTLQGQGGVMQLVQSRRRFLTALSSAGAAGLVGLRAKPTNAEPPSETTRIRLIHDPSICVAPQYLAEELLRADGFSDVQYIEAADGSGAR